MKPQLVIVAVLACLSAAASEATQLARGAGDYALAGVAFRARVEDRRLRDVRIAFCGLSDRPATSASAAALIEQSTTTPSATALGEAIARDVEPIGDPVHPASLRLHLAAVLAGRIVSELRS